MPLDFTQKVGPLPAWGWGVGLGAVGVVFLWFRNRSGASSTPDATAAEGTAVGQYASGAVAPVDPFPNYDPRGAIAVGSGVDYGTGTDLPVSTGAFPASDEIADAVASGVGAGYASLPPAPTAEEIGASVAAAIPPPAPAPVTVPKAPAPATPAPKAIPGPPKGKLLWVGQSKPNAGTINALIRSRYPGLAVKWEPRQAGNGKWVAVVI